MKKIIVILILLSSSLLFAQKENWSVILKVGRASFNDAFNINFGGGGVGNKHWATGPIFSFGLERRLGNSFSFQGIFSYSHHKYSGDLNYFITDGNNNVLELMGNIKLNMGVYYLIAGMGISHQNSDEVRYRVTPITSSNSIVIKPKTNTVFAGLFGVGLNVHVYDKFYFLCEGDIYLREYVGSALLIGIKYSIK